MLTVSPSSAHSPTTVAFAFMPAGKIVASDSITLALPSFQAGGGTFAALGVCTITSTGWMTPTMPQMANASYRTVNITSAIDYNNMAPIISDSPAITTVVYYEPAGGQVGQETIASISSPHAAFSCFTLNETDQTTVVSWGKVFVVITCIRSCFRSCCKVFVAITCIRS